MYGVGGTELDLLSEAANGMREQRAQLDLDARNVAAAQASTPGHPYARLVARFEHPETSDLSPSAAGDDASDIGDDPGDTPFDGASPLMAVRAEPGTGDALTEMIAVLDAQRAYEQHASVFDIGKRLAERTIDVGRG